MAFFEARAIVRQFLLPVSGCIHCGRLQQLRVRSQSRSAIVENAARPTISELTPPRQTLWSTVSDIRSA